MLCTESLVGVGWTLGRLLVKVVRLWNEEGKWVGFSQRCMVVVTITYPLLRASRTWVLGYLLRELVRSKERNIAL